MAANPSLPDFITMAIKESEEKYANYIRQGQNAEKPGAWGYGQQAHGLFQKYLKEYAESEALHKLEQYGEYKKEKALEVANNQRIFAEVNQYNSVREQRLNAALDYEADQRAIKSGGAAFRARLLSRR